MILLEISLLSPEMTMLLGSPLLSQTTLLQGRGWIPGIYPGTNYLEKILRKSLVY